MYIRGVHAETHIPTLRKLIHDFPLGVLTTALSSTAGPFIQSSHIPFILDVEDEASESELGRLRGHLARVNPQSKAMIEAVTKSNASEGSTPNVLEQEVLVLFTAPAQHYVTPKFYTETKPTTGKVVPTWNYAAVQAYGRARIYFDSASEDTSAFLSKQIWDLSEHAERNIMNYTGPENSRPSSWKVTDSPERYIGLLQKAIIGIEIQIDRLEGKFKMSQEMGEGDRKGVVEGLQSLETEIADNVAKLVDERGRAKGKAD